MDLHLLVDNLTNPALMFFILGLLAAQLKSDLEIPKNSSKFISLYLLLAIGFKGGQELAHSTYGNEIFYAILAGILLALIVPIYTFFILKLKFTAENAGAIAAAYGSVSAVTFVTAVSFLELEGIEFGGHMVAVMALMEAPSIIVGVLLMRIYSNGKKTSKELFGLLKHAMTNGSVFLILGSLVIGFMASDAQAEGIHLHARGVEDLGVQHRGDRALVDRGRFAEGQVDLDLHLRGGMQLARDEHAQTREINDLFDGQ